jgi:hypothetical protein
MRRLRRFFRSDRIAYQALITSRLAAVLSFLAVCLNVVVAIVAITSLRLNVTTAEQARNTSQTQIDLNRQLADATTKQAEASIKVAEAAKQSADLTLALERPYIVISEVKFVQPAGSDDPSPQIDYGFVNVGRVPATLRLFYIDCTIVDNVPSIPEFSKSLFRPASNAISAGAFIGSTTIPATLPKCILMEPITPEIYEQLRAGKKIILFKSLMIYEGALGLSYTGSVGLRYDFKTSHFYPVGDTYNGEEAATARLAQWKMPTPKYVP